MPHSQEMAAKILELRANCISKPSFEKIGFGKKIWSHEGKSKTQIVKNDAFERMQPKRRIWYRQEGERQKLVCLWNQKVKTMLTQNWYNSKKLGNGHISILYPGKAIGHPWITRFCLHCRKTRRNCPRFVIAMPLMWTMKSCPTLNRKSETYGFWRVQNFIEPFSPNAHGKLENRFFHEEKILDNSDVLEGSKYSSRPKEKTEARDYFSRAWPYKQH